MPILQTQQRGGEWENDSSRDEGREDGLEGGRGMEEEGGGIDLTLGESHHSSVHFHSSVLVMWVLIWRVGWGGGGVRGI